MQQSFADILRDLDGSSVRKLSRKAPEWSALPGGPEIPSSLSVEQCSSTAAARYKCRVLGLGAGSGKVVTDITGGLGVDSWVFSRAAAKVNYIERQSALADAARRNFAALGADNISVRCEEAGPGTRFPVSDIIYADPSRRDGQGRKVFRPEDCSPDIFALMPVLLDAAPSLLVKLSPMADISIVASRFGERLAEVHTVQLRGEVKELLCLVRRDHTGACRRIVAELDPEETFEYGALPCGAGPVICEGFDAGGWIVEPGPGLQKSGAYAEIARRFGISQADTGTHLFFSSVPVRSALLKCFRITEIRPFSSSSVRTLRKDFPAAEIISRNLHISSEALRRKAGIADGGDCRIFACRTASRGNVLIICSQK